MTVCQQLALEGRGPLLGSIEIYSLRDSCPSRESPKSGMDQPEIVDPGASWMTIKNEVTKNNLETNGGGGRVLKTPGGKVVKIGNHALGRGHSE